MVITHLLKFQLLQLLLLHFLHCRVVSGNLHISATPLWRRRSQLLAHRLVPLYMATTHRGNHTVSLRWQHKKKYQHIRLFQMLVIKTNKQWIKRKRWCSIIWGCPVNRTKHNYLTIMAIRIWNASVFRMYSRNRTSPWQDPLENGKWSC